MNKLRLGRHATADGQSNTGHGHVYLRPDGERIRCGGPALCSECSRDLMRLMNELHPPRPSGPVVKLRPTEESES